MRSQEVEILNDLGMHARASAKLTQLAGQFQSDIWLSRKNKRVNAKSIMGVMMLAATKGSQVLIEADGPDEQQAVETLVGLINDHFGEKSQLSESG